MSNDINCEGDQHLFFLQLAGLLSISSRFLPTVMNLLKRLAEEAQGYSTSEATQPQSSTTTVSQTFRNEVQKPNAGSSSIPRSSVSSVRSSSGDNENEHSTTNLTHRRSTNVPQAEFS